MMESLHEEWGVGGHLAALLGIWRAGGVYSRRGETLLVEDEM